MAKQYRYIAVTVIKNGTKTLNPGDEMPERFVKAPEREALVKAGALRIEEVEAKNPPKQQPEETADEPLDGEDSDEIDTEN